MIDWLLDWWHKRQRTIDIQILWPLCKEHAQNLDQARAAFAVHALRDEAWLCLGEDETCRRIDEMT